MKKFPLGEITLIGDELYDVPCAMARTLASLGFERRVFPSKNKISFYRWNERPSRIAPITKEYLDDVVEFRLSKIVVNSTDEDVLITKADVDVVIDSDGETIYNIAKALGLDYTAAILSPNRGDIRE
jgi:hypothetical protein